MTEKTAAKKSNLTILIGAIVAIIIFVGVYFFLIKKDAVTDNSVAVSQATNEQTDMIESLTPNVTGKLARDLLHDPFYMKVQVTESGMSLTMTIAKSGDKMYIELPLLGMKMLSDATRSCSINDENQTYSCDANSEDAGTSVFDEETLAFLAQKPVIGTATVNGATYETEAYSDEVIGYYDGEQLRYLSSSDDDTLLKIVEYRNNADASLFAIPAGYTEVTDAAGIIKDDIDPQGLDLTIDER